MLPRLALLLTCVLAASAASAEPVYKYRRADGQLIYSNRVLRDVELIETFDERRSASTQRVPARARPASGAAADDRIKTRLDALGKGWIEVQDATHALQLAEARLKAAEAPVGDEGTALGGPAPGDAVPGILSLASTAVGGPMAPSAAAVGGPQPIAPPAPGQTVAQAAAVSRAVGGPIGSRRGGGRNAAYFDRMYELNLDVLVARVRLDVARGTYNQLY